MPRISSFSERIARKLLFSQERQSRGKKRYPSCRVRYVPDRHLLGKVLCLVLRKEIDRRINSSVVNRRPGWRSSNSEVFNEFGLNLPLFYYREYTLGFGKVWYSSRYRFRAGWVWEILIYKPWGPVPLETSISPSFEEAQKEVEEFFEGDE